MSKKFKLLFLLLCQPLDGLLTYIGIQRAGTVDVEGNPIIHFLISRSGEDGLTLFIVKLIACIFVLFLMLVTKKDESNVYNWLINFCVLVYTYVILTWSYVLYFGVLS
jgi:uncharacterized membrane protein